MKKKPQVHFWVEWIETVCTPTGGYIDTVYALNVCRAWDVPANGVFLIFTDKELYTRHFNPHTKFVWKERNQRCCDKVVAKLEARERALVNFYGRHAKHHLDQIELTPEERRERSRSVSGF